MPPHIPDEPHDTPDGDAAEATLAAAGATTRRFREAAEAHDIDALLDTLAEDVVLRSPITDRVRFQGRAELGELMRSVFATVEDIHYFADVGDARTRALFDRARVGGQALEQAVRVQLNARQQIQEITIFFRPLPGLASLTAALAPRVARKRGRLRYIMARILLAPLALATRAGDRLAPWLA
jgi:SnoaL-like protein